MENIKLVIWDLDDTFWQGTLSDGEVSAIDENVQLVKNLTDKGIVNSICSKNDYDKVKAKLVDFGVWDYFVFPSIDWTNKGERIKKIIDDIQLRAENVLFVDDNVNNLKEVEFACMGVQTATPDKLPELIKTDAFEGKDDSSHSRLQQYKVLEQKTIAKTEYGSNEDFLYQSEIKVEMIEDCSDVLERMHEMIHRNNQLNFTKDRISREKSDKLFTDRRIRSGYVKVTDKYGDHGIVGCYAVKNGRAVQFVFSCRILGMGVEQYVYAELNYPKIKIVGEVAGELKQSEKPGWINSVAGVKENVSPILPEKTLEQLRVIAYGSCPIRPLCSYLSPKLPNFKFDEIDSAPTVCNIAVTKRFPDTKTAEWVTKINLFSAGQTFDKELFSENTDAVVINLIHEWGIWKYTSKTDGIYFYTAKLNGSVAGKDILDDYSETPITLEDIKTELTYIRENLSANTKLAIMTASEVEFPQFGKDANYWFRVQSNKLIDELAAKYANVIVLDARKYAKTPADHFDPSPQHMNRSIGFALASDFFKAMKIETELTPPKTDRPAAETGLEPPANAVRQKNAVSGNAKDIPEYVAYIRNGKLVVEISMPNESGYEIRYEFWRNRFIESRIDFSDNWTQQVSVTKTGSWMVKAFIRCKDDFQITYNFASPQINYTAFNYMQYVDPAAENYDVFKGALNQLVNDNQDVYNIRRTLLRGIANLAAGGVNVADYFLDRGINEISVFADQNIGEILLPFLRHSKLKIREIYTQERDWWFLSDGELVRSGQAAKELNAPPPLGANDHLLYAVDFSFTGDALGIFNKLPCKRYFLSPILAALMTKKFFIERAKTLVASPLVMSVRLPSLASYNAFPYTNITANEKAAHKFIPTDIVAIQKLTKEFDRFPAQFKGLSMEELQETLKRPAFYDRKPQISAMRDVKGQFLNIENGFRKTPGQPEKYIGTIYLFGSFHTFGCGVKDGDTIASHLQNIIGLPYKVENYANCWDNNYSQALRLLFDMEFKQNDIAVILHHNWVNQNNDAKILWHWLAWDAMESPIVKVDAWPIFQKVDRPDYFLLPQAINAEGNLRIAEVLRDAVYENIRLF